MHQPTQLIIRHEQPSDIPAIRALHDAAFKNPGEGKLVDLLRQNNHLTLSLVTLTNENKIIAHIAFSPVTIIDPQTSQAIPTPNPGLGLAPVAVLPTHQSQGVGTKLINHSLTLIRAQRQNPIGYLIVLGDPKYYSRFGFQPAHTTFKLGNEYHCQDEFQAQELIPASLANTQNKTARYAPEFASTDV